MRYQKLYHQCSMVRKTRIVDCTFNFLPLNPGLKFDIRFSFGFIICRLSYFLICSLFFDNLMFNLNKIPVIFFTTKIKVNKLGSRYRVDFPEYVFLLFTYSFAVGPGSHDHMAITLQELVLNFFNVVISICIK